MYAHILTIWMPKHVENNDSSSPLMVMMVKSVMHNVHVVVWAQCPVFLTCTRSDFHRAVLIPRVL